MTEPPSKHSSGQQNMDEQIECASPPCYAADLADPPLPQQELIDLLNELATGERAGAQGLIEMAKNAASDESRTLLREIAADEARYCAMLSHHVERLGGTPDRTVGVFADKLARRESLPDKLTLLDKGQSVVVRMLEETLPRITDDKLKEDLIEMRDVHVVNIDRCREFSLQI
ncbi:MAG: DUF6306 domain-containing protein [Pseudomonadales bacterium]